MEDYGSTARNTVASPAAALPRPSHSKLRVLDLFSGIGGFSLGLERTGGFETVAFCEIEPYCRRVLAKHWPHVPCYADARELTADTLRRDGIAVDVICGGFPCQDISFAGKRAGLEGARSGLWSEYARLIGELRPRFIIVENVPGLLSLGMGDVLGELSTLGYDAVWDCIPACAVGAHHRRDRVWIVAYPNGQGERASPVNAEVASAPHVAANAVSNELRQQQGRSSGACRTCETVSGNDGEARSVAYAERGRLQGRDEQCAQPTTIIFAEDRWHSRGLQQWSARWAEPDVGRVAYGLPAQMDRLKALGNSVVPQIPELIGRAILEAAA